MKLQGLTELLVKLRQKQLAARKTGNASAIVGYTARYAIYVHENKEMKLFGQPRPSGLGTYWGPHGTFKFLEAPARRLSKTLGKIVSDTVKSGRTLSQGLYIAALRLLRESLEQVPVEYGNLRASGFARLEDNV